MNMEERVEYALSHHKQSYNCCQCVLMAYKDYFEITEEQLMKLSMGLGGGVGAYREICGCALGGAMLLSEIYGSGSANPTLKNEVQECIQKFLDEFKDTYGSVVCGELLGLRPCANQITKPSCHEQIGETIQMLEKHVNK